MIVPKQVKTWIENGHYLEGCSDKLHDVSLLRKVAQGEDLRPEVRVVIGATACMPLRVLSYVDTAAKLADRMNASRLQIVHAIRLATAVNGLDPRATEQTALNASQVMSEYLRKAHPEVARLTGICIDTPAAVTVSEEVAGRVRSDVELPASLSKMGRSKGDTLRYLAGHVVYLDSTLMTTDVIESGEDYTNDTPTALVNVGHKRERPFSDGRNRIISVLRPDEIIEVRAQIYTRHEQPPYIMDRDGDLSLAEALTAGVSGFGLSMAGSAARRDMAAMGHRLDYAHATLREATPWAV